MVRVRLLDARLKDVVGDWCRGFGDNGCRDCQLLRFYYFGCLDLWLLLVGCHGEGCELSAGSRCIIAEASGARPVSPSPEGLVHELLRCVHLGYVLLSLVQLLVQIELHHKRTRPMKDRGSCEHLHLC